jgi:hypothetical protein
MQNIEQLGDNIIKIVGIIAVEDKPAIVDMLKRNGSLVTEKSTTDEIIDATLKAIKDNTRFRNDFKQYIIQVSQSENDNSFSNKDGAGKEKLKNIFNSIFSEENITKAVGLGMDYASNKMNANAQKSTNQQAIDFEKAKAQNSALELAKLDALSRLPQTTQSSKKWVLPVAIGGGVLVLGVILYFALRKK